MAPKQSTVEDLIIALRDVRVVEALGGIFETKLLSVVTELKEDNDRKATQITKLQCELKSANSRLEALECYTRRDNLLITGLAIGSYAEAAATDNDGTPQIETSQAVECSVLKLFNEQMGIPIQSSDISIAHRLPKRQGAPGSPTTIVKFSNRKAREAVYSARRKLRNSAARIYINEDLNKTTAELYRQSRLLVKSKQIHSTWTTGCTVFIKESSDPRCRPKKIIQLSDLPTTTTRND